MLYTSYFGGLKRLPQNTTPISIAAKTPDWFIDKMGGHTYHPLAPKFDLLKGYKSGDIKEAEYVPRYNGQLFMLIPQQVLQDLESYLPIQVMNGSIDKLVNAHIALLCYEKPGDFCHRNLVAKWFNDNGIKCEEWLK